jgi:hypothetical protein
MNEIKHLPVYYTSVLLLGKMSQKIKLSKNINNISKNSLSVYNKAETFLSNLIEFITTTTLRNSFSLTCFST